MRSTRRTDLLRTLTTFALALPLTVAPLSALEVSRIPLDKVQTPAAAGARLQPDVVQQAVEKATFTIQYDDGEADNGYGPGAGATFYDIVMRFDLPQTNLTVDSVEVCFSRLGADDSLDFELTFWQADGAGGSPGTLIDAFLATATDVTEDLAGSYYTYDLSSFGLMMPSNTVYIGVGWDAVEEVDFFACSDNDRSTIQPAYSMLDQSGIWNTPPAQDSAYRAMMFRGVFTDAEGPGPSTCTPDATTLCLNNDRFRVQANWRTPQGATGQGQAVELTDDTGYFWFFNQNNVEMVLKVLRGCGVNNRYWVFAGGLTDVEVDLVVTDTQTGISKPYSNPLRTPFQPIQDTNAFATCP